MSCEKKKSGLGKFIAGAAIGAGLGILFAPKKGSETRRELKEKMDELVNKAKDIDMEEVKETFERKVKEYRLANHLDDKKIDNNDVKKKDYLKPIVDFLLEYYLYIIIGIGIIVLISLLVLIIKKKKKRTILE